MAVNVPLPTDDRVVQQHGRYFSYYGLVHNAYAVPIDWVCRLRLPPMFMLTVHQKEQEQSADLDELVREAVGGRSLYVPLPTPVRVRNAGTAMATDDLLPTVLDCGFGSGRWIEALLQERNFQVDVSFICSIMTICASDWDIKVTGIDICLKQDTCVEDDVDDTDPGIEGSEHRIDDFEKKRWNLNIPLQADRSEDRLRPESFDVVNSRFMAGGIDDSRWPGYIGEIRKLLKRGGWVQMVELIPHVQSDNGRLSDESFLATWWTSYSRVLTSMLGRNIRIGRELERMLTQEGFNPVHGCVFDLPLGRWKRSIMPLPRGLQ